MAVKRHERVQSKTHVEGLANDRRMDSEFSEGEGARMHVGIDTFRGRREGRN